jgi:outer membrane protein assembly factor BamA
MRFVFIILFLLGNGIVFAASPDDLQNEHVSIIFYVNDNISALPSGTVEKLQTLPIAEWDDALIIFLIQENIYKSVEVQSYMQKNGVILVVRAKPIIKIQDIRIVGIPDQEQADYKRSLLSQTGDTYDPRFLETDRERLREALAQRGYPNGVVHEPTVSLADNDFVNIKIDVDKGHPCIY